MTRKNTLMNSLLVSGTILMTFNFCVFPSQAQAGATPGEVNTEGEMKVTCPAECEPWPEKLGLTDEQMEKLIDLKSDYEIKNAEKKAQLMSNMKEMALLMTAAKTDKDAIFALNEKSNTLKAELSTTRVRKMLDAMSVMTPKQKEQIHHHILVHMLSHHAMGEKHHGYRHHH